MMDSTLDRIRIARQASPDAIVAGTGAGRADRCAIGWATVELDRAASELAADLGISPGAFVDALDSLTLGARCRVAASVLPGGLTLAILEPAWEGRLAATLARLGEGPAVTWYRTDTPVDIHASSPRSGPFGSERLVTGDPVHGPHRLLIGTGAGTIAS